MIFQLTVNRLSNRYYEVMPWQFQIIAENLGEFRRRQAGLVLIPSEGIS